MHNSSLYQEGFKLGQNKLWSIDTCHRLGFHTFLLKIVEKNVITVVDILV